MKFKSSQGNYNALEQDKMLKEHETHAMLNVIFILFIFLKDCFPFKLAKEYMELSEYSLRHEQPWQEWRDGSRGRTRPVYACPR